MTTTTTTPDPLREAAQRAFDAVSAWMSEAQLIRPLSVDAALMALGYALEGEPAPAQGDATRETLTEPLVDALVEALGDMASCDGRPEGEFPATECYEGHLAEMNRARVALIAELRALRHPEAATGCNHGDGKGHPCALPDVERLRALLHRCRRVVREEGSPELSSDVEREFTVSSPSPSQPRPLQCVCDLPSEAAGPCPVHQPAAFSAPQPQPDGEVDPDARVKKGFRLGVQAAAREVSSTSFHLTTGGTFTLDETIGVFERVRDELASRIRSLSAAPAPEPDEEPVTLPNAVSEAITLAVLAGYDHGVGAEDNYRELSERSERYKRRALSAVASALAQARREGTSKATPSPSDPGSDR